VQTQTESKTQLTDHDRDIAAAEKQLATLRDAAANLEAVAAELAESDEPTEAAAVATLVAQRRARRARAAAEAYEHGELHELKAKRNAQRSAIDAEKLRQHVADLDAVLANASAAIANAVEALAAIPTEMQRFTRETRGLSGGVSYAHTQLAKRLTEVYAPLAKYDGVRLYALGSHPDVIRLEIERPCAPKG
jgi:chromosome segregation ATPase